MRGGTQVERQGVPVGLRSTPFGKDRLSRLAETVSNASRLSRKARLNAIKGNGSRCARPREGQTDIEAERLSVRSRLLTWQFNLREYRPMFHWFSKIGRGLRGPMIVETGVHLSISHFLSVVLVSRDDLRNSRCARDRSQADSSIQDASRADFWEPVVFKQQGH